MGCIWATALFWRQLKLSTELPPLSTAILVNLERIFKGLNLLSLNRLKWIAVAKTESQTILVLYMTKYTENNLAAKTLGNTLGVIIMAMKISGVYLNV